MDFGEVLSRAWQIIWKHKALWIFGILAGCTSGSSNSAMQDFSYSFDGGELPRNLQPYFDRTFGVEGWQAAAFIAVIVLVVLVLIVLAVFLGTIGRIGLIRGTLKAEQSSESLSFGELFRGGMPYFWRVFGLNLFIALVIAAIAIVFAILAMVTAFATLGIALICMIPLFCLLLPVGWFVGIIIEQANVALVVEDIGILEAIQRGWDVVKDNVGAMIVMGLILLIGGGIAAALLTVPFALVVLPVVFGAVSGNDAGLGLGIGVSLLCGVVYLPILLVLSGILRAYIGSAWTLTYLRLSSKPTTTIVSSAEPA